MLYPLTCEDLISFADKNACSALTKRQESNYDHYDFIDFFRSIHDAFLYDMKQCNYYFFDDDDDMLDKYNDSDYDDNIPPDTYDDNCGDDSN